MDVLHHHDGAVHENAEVNRANRQEIGGNALEVEADESEQQREWNRRGDDEPGANVEEEEHENDDDQHDAAQQIVLHHPRGERDQIHAIVKRVDLHILRQDVVIEFFRLRLGELQHGLRLLAGAHQDHALDGIVAIVESELAQTGRIADHHRADVFDEHGNAVRRGRDDDVADVLGRGQPRQPAHVIELPAFGVESAARVVIVRSQRVRHVGDRESRARKLRRIDEDLILHRLSAEVRHVGYARDALERLGEDPVIDDLQLHRRTIRTVEHVAVHETRR